MKHAILWLNEYGLTVLGLVLAFTAVSAVVGLAAALALDYPVGWPGFLHGVLVGDGWLIGGGLASWGIAYGWMAAVKWAKSPPRVKPLPPEFCQVDAPADEFLVAAKREVEIIAPSDS